MARITTRSIVLCAIVAALYAVMTVFLAPIGYGVLQFRTACILYGLILFDPIFAFGLALGVFVANLASPFGPLDFLAMPIVALLGGLLMWYMRRWSILATLIMATIISAGVAAFPLGLGAHLPFIPTFAGILITQVVIITGGWILIWHPLRKTFNHILHTDISTTRHGE